MKHPFCITFLFLCTALLVKGQQVTIDTISIEGNKRTRSEWIKKILLSRAQENLDSSLLDKDIIALKRLPAISHAYYEVRQSNKGSASCHVTFYLDESFTLIPEVNVWSVDGLVATKVGLYEYNFAGRNIGIGGFYQYNRFNSYGFFLRAPQLFGRSWGVSLSHQLWTSEEPVFFASGNARYRYQNRSFEALGIWQWNFSNKLEFGVNFFTEDYEYLSGEMAAGVPLELTLDKTLFKVFYQFDRFNYNYQYVSGIRNQLYLQYVATENAFQDAFWIGWNDFFYFKRVGNRGNWANRFRFGISSNDESPFAPFAVDNNVNIRGVGFIIDRGTASMVLNTEYRYTLVDKGWFALQGNAFLDAGTWRNPGGTLNDFWDPDNFRIYPGFGLRFIHKKIYNAIFRIDYGHGISRKASRGIVFGIGQYF